jgi:hypothetical protein
MSFSNLSFGDFVGLGLGLAGLAFVSWLLEQTSQAFRQRKRTTERKLPLTNHRQILADYFALMERRPFLPSRIEDVSVLPHPKALILDALLREIRQTRSDDVKMRLGWAAAGLAQYQPNAGAEPLEMLGVNLSALPKTNDINVLRKEAQYIASLDSQRAKFNEANKIYRDSPRIRKNPLPSGPTRILPSA